LWTAKADSGDAGIARAAEVFRLELSFSVLVYRFFAPSIPPALARILLRAERACSRVICSSTILFPRPGPLS
jgi:hypothetical protein